MASPTSSCTFKNLVTLETCFQSILSIRICDCGAQFLVNCFQKIVIATNNSGFNSTYLLVSESEGKAKDKKCREQELTGKLVKKIQVENLSSIWDLHVLTHSWSWQSFVSSSDVLTCLFALDLQKEIQPLSTFFCYSWLASLLGCGWEMCCSTKRNRKIIIVFKNKLLLVSLLHLARLCEKSWAILALFDGSICTFVRFETNYLTASKELKKYLDIFWPQLERNVLKNGSVILLFAKRN